MKFLNRIFAALLLVGATMGIAQAQTVRILTVFSPQAVSMFGSSNLQNIVNTNMSNFQQAFVNSGITGVQMVSAGILASSNGALDNNFSDTSFNSGLWQLQHDEMVLQTRDVTNADIVVAYVSSVNNTGAYGLAQMTNATPANAFAVVTTNSVWEFSYLHEVGHLLGARHQDKRGDVEFRDDRATSPPNGHGYTMDYQTDVTRGIGCIYDIMGMPSVDSRCVNTAMARDLMFSNPNRTWVNYWGATFGIGWAAGDSTSWSANVVMANTAQASGWHLTKLSGGGLGSGGTLNPIKRNLGMTMFNYFYR